MAACVLLGVPQGSMLRPLLCLLYMTVFLAVQFTDDIVHIVREMTSSFDQELQLFLIHDPVHR